MKCKWQKNLLNGLVKATGIENRNVKKTQNLKTDILS